MSSTEAMQEDCPSWCERIHSPTDHVEDRRHQSEAEVVALSLAATQPPGPALVNLDGVVHLDRGGDSEITWVRVETTESTRLRFSMSLGSAIRLARALDAAIHRADTRDDS